MEIKCHMMQVWQMARLGNRQSSLVPRMWDMSDMVVLKGKKTRGRSMLYHSSYSGTLFGTWAEFQ